MNNRMDSEEKLENLILLRLMVSTVPFTPFSDIKKDLKSLFPGSWSDGNAKSRILQSLDTLEYKETISRNARKSSAITDKGRDCVLRFLHMDQWPANAKWKTVKSQYLTRLALDINSRHELQLTAKADGFRIAALRDAYDLQIVGKPTLAKTVDALLAKLLKPNRSGIDALRTAAIRRWLEGESETTENADFSDVPEFEIEPPAAFDPRRFVEDALNTAKACETGWFGDNKVFISHVWKKFENEHPEYRMDEVIFKARLVELARGNLSRADLVSIMDSKDVAESEVRYLNAVFHFIRVERKPT